LLVKGPKGSLQVSAALDVVINLVFVNILELVFRKVASKKVQGEIAATSVGVVCDYKVAIRGGNGYVFKCKKCDQFNPVWAIFFDAVNLAFDFVSASVGEREY